MTETHPKSAAFRNRTIILWIFVIIACAGLALVCIRRCTQRTVSLPSPSETPTQKEPPEPAAQPVVASIPEVKSQPVASIVRVPAAKPQPPAVRHFVERISSDGPEANDSSAGWVAGRPIIPDQPVETDSVDALVFYRMPDGSVIEYDLRSNRYRVFAIDSLGTPQRMDQLDPLDRIGGLRSRRIR